MRLFALIALLMLGACATPTVGVQQVCLPLTSYTPAQEAAAGQALAALDPTNPLVVFMGDYSAMRSSDRACLAKGT